jgi:hypothetical protein
MKCVSAFSKRDFKFLGDLLNAVAEIFHELGGSKPPIYHTMGAQVLPPPNQDQRMSIAQTPVQSFIGLPWCHCVSHHGRHVAGLAKYLATSVENKG